MGIRRLTMMLVALAASVMLIIGGGAFAQDNTRQIAVESTTVGGPAGKRVAFVVGNNSYSNLPAESQLVTAVNDARAVKAALAAIGFDVVYGENLTRDQFLEKFGDFQSRIESGSLALFYYAGHGVQLENGGGNYLLPSDIIRPSGNRAFESDRLAESSIEDTYVVKGMKKAGASVEVVVLDACRNNPLAGSDTRALPGGGAQGLARVDYPKGVFSIYSAGFNETALDRLPGDAASSNSVFTRSFIKYLTKPGLTLQELARQVSDEVDATTQQAGHSQSPAYVDQVRGRKIYLAGPPEQPEQPGSSASGTTGNRASNAEMQFELQYWNDVKDSKDPQSFELYINQFPNGTFVALARQKLEGLKVQEKQAQDRHSDEEKVWQQASAATDVPALQQYLAAYPEGEHAAEARMKMAQLSAAAPQADADSVLWDAVKDSSDPDRLNIYLDKFPSGRFAAEARSRLSQIEVNQKAQAAQEELRAWEAVQYSSDPQSYTDFANRFPQSTFASFARQKADLLRQQRSQENTTTYTPPPPQDDSAAIRNVAMQVPDYIERIWSQDNSTAVSQLMALYSSSVQYYGSTYSYDRVYTDKQNFANKWDVRRYEVQPGSISVSCNGNICDIDFKVNWDARSTAKGKRSRGLAASNYRVRVSGNNIEILAESGHVINRY